MSDSAALVNALHAQLVVLDAPDAKECDFSAYLGRPLDWITDVLRVELWTKQREIIEALETERQVAVPGAVAVGKDFVGCCYGLYWAFVRRGRVIFSGATLSQVTNVAMRTAIQLWTRANLPGIPLKMSLVTPAGDILARTSKEAGKLSGIHDPRGVFVACSEAQDVGDGAFEGLASCVAGADDRFVAIGNPTRADGWFARASQSVAWRVIPIDGLAHPNVIEGRERFRGAITREYVATTKANFGEHSSVYRARVRGWFPESSVVENALFTRSLIDACTRAAAC
jgi:hypothetical protein